MRKMEVYRYRSHYSPGDHLGLMTWMRAIEMWLLSERYAQEYRWNKLGIGVVGPADTHL